MLERNLMIGFGRGLSDNEFLEIGHGEDIKHCIIWANGLQHTTSQIDLN